MEKKSKKEIRTKVEESLNDTLAALDVAVPSKKTKKLIESAAKKISTLIKSDVRKQAKKLAKAAKSEQKNGKVLLPKHQLKGQKNAAS